MKVILHKLFPYAPYLNEYIGFEKDIDDSADPFKAVALLREMTEIAHRERYPHLYPNGNEAMVESFAPPIQQEKLTNEERKQQTIQSHIKTINECNTLQNLNIFKGLAENNQEIKYVFDNKLKELTNGLVNS